MQEFLDAIVNFFKGDGLTVARTVSVLIFGLILVQLLMRAVKSGLVRAKVERTVSSFLSSIIGVSLYFLLFLWSENQRVFRLPATLRWFRLPVLPCPSP
jgi:hypothetical protein